MKRCSKCGRDKPLEEFRLAWYWRKTKGWVSWRRGVCTRCYNGQHSKKYHERQQRSRDFAIVATTG